ncbi:MAG: tRNA uridine-5-carboxymethylaminomethyl(34) synthesis GTPase MnmE [Treponema sp.]|nr:tRNA uridine-5-carboxymethylaminomethyl(34) synthesis GTPase MnmE [Treponema sp.]
MTPNQYTPEEPISSIATALAPAALGIVRASGKNCIELVSKIFSRPKALLEAAGNTLVYGWIVDKGGEIIFSNKSEKTVQRTIFSDLNDKSSLAPASSLGQDLAARASAIPSAGGGAPRNAPLAETAGAGRVDSGATGKQTTCAVDEVMLAVYRAPKSFTGEDMVEIFCHGGPAVVTAIQNLMLRSGFRQANRGEYTFRAFINGKTDLTKAEAVKEIIDSHTDASRSHAVGRLAGNLFTEIDSIKKLIIDTLAAIEVEIEYPEDEETIADSFDRADIELAISRLQTLCDSWKGEKLYQDGARVVLAGRTNAGKSSLFNAILKEERAIVSDIEGTTRDWLESWASINGIPVRLFDTAGLRKTDDVIEAQGVELSKNLAQDADVVLYLVDGTTGMNDEDKAFIQACREPVIVVFTKSDKKDSPIKPGNDTPPAVSSFGAPMLSSDEPDVSSSGNPMSSASATLSLSGLTGQSIPTCRISSKTGDGLSELFAQITKILTAGITTSTERQQAGLGSARQKEAVANALECVRHALISADDNYTLDAVVQDLEDALDFLGEVTGDVTPDDVLGSIFANFCVGK